MRGLRLPLQLIRYKVDGEWDGKTYKLGKPMEYCTKGGIIWTVPKGFVTECAAWIRRRGRFEEAAVLHDFLYSEKVGRKYADKIFKEAMERACCPKWRINMFYYGVRAFGWMPYYFGGK